MFMKVVESVHRGCVQRSPGIELLNRIAVKKAHILPTLTVFRCIHSRTPCYQIKVSCMVHETASTMLNPNQSPMMTLLFF